MIKTIKACPFCGAEAELIQKTSGYTTSPTVIRNEYVVICTSCKSSTPRYSSYIWQDKNGEVRVDENGAESAIEAWNSRNG